MNSNSSEYGHEEQKAVLLRIRELLHEHNEVDPTPELFEAECLLDQALTYEYDRKTIYQYFIEAQNQFINQIATSDYE